MLLYRFVEFIGFGIAISIGIEKAEKLNKFFNYSAHS